MNDPRVAKLRALRDGAGTEGERVAAERALERLGAAPIGGYSSAEVDDALRAVGLLRAFMEEVAVAAEAAALAIGELAAAFAACGWDHGDAEPLTPLQTCKPPLILAAEVGHDRHSEDLYPHLERREP